jgi:ABC-2 type transport system ATP-binding protein
VRVVDSVSLRVEEGTIFGLLGPSGSGKSTLARMLLGCVRPSAGRVWLFGLDAADAAARRNTGYVPEHFFVPEPLTARDMLLYHGTLAGVRRDDLKSRIAEVCERLGIADTLGERLIRLPRAKLQLLGLAQALLPRPRLLVLDEPADGLDPSGHRNVLDLFSELAAQGTAIVLNSHHLADVEACCHRVAILCRGSVSREGNVAELTAGGGFQVDAAGVPQAVLSAVAGTAVSCDASAPHVRLVFAKREDAYAALDAIRAGGGVLESFGPARSTLEQVYLDTVERAARA